MFGQYNPGAMGAGASQMGRGFAPMQIQQLLQQLGGKGGQDEFMKMMMMMMLMRPGQGPNPFVKETPLTSIAGGVGKLGKLAMMLFGVPGIGKLFK